MIHRQRAIAAIRGEPLDRIPFIARMDLWYNYNYNGGTLPGKYRGWSSWDFQRDLDIGIFGFGAWSVKYYKLVYHNIQVHNPVRLIEELTECVTPSGTLRTRILLSAWMVLPCLSRAGCQCIFPCSTTWAARLFLRAVRPSGQS